MNLDSQKKKNKNKMIFKLDNDMQQSIRDVKDWYTGGRKAFCSKLSCILSGRLENVWEIIKKKKFSMIIVGVVVVKVG